MAETKSSNHVAMFPWFAFGHFTPFLLLSNKLAERGHKISFLVPKGTMSKLTHLNQHPQLIHFVPIVVPQVDGLPPGAETASDVPFEQHDLLCAAFDQTEDQVKTILNTIKPGFVFCDFAYWIPALGREIGFKSVCYMIVSASRIALRLNPVRKLIKGMTLEELMQTPPGYPSSIVVPRPDEIARIKLMEDYNGLSLYERFTTSIKESDAIAIRTCREIEGSFCDYIAQQYGKPVLLTGHVLPEKPPSQLEEKWDKWLSKFDKGSVVYCAFGSQAILKKNEFQEILLGFELCGLPFLVALATPEGCSTIEEALPEGFEQRVRGRGWVCGDWVPQPLILDHPSVGCFVSHCGPSSMWEFLLQDCQLVLIPHLSDHFTNATLMVEELKIAVEVKREENGWISKESLSKAIKLVTEKDSDVATVVKRNHAKWKKILSGKHVQESHIDTFIRNLQGLLQ